MWNTIISNKPSTQHQNHSGNWLKKATVLMLLFSAAFTAWATGAPIRPQITDSIDENNLVTLSGNTHPAAMNPANDQGPVADSLILNHMYMQLKRSPGVQQSVDSLIEALHNPQSPQYHQWLTADQIAAQFGTSDQDMQTLSNWLTSHGFTINVLYPANGVIDFSGPAASVREAFHTEIHNLTVNGKSHIANASDPKIPAALASVVQGLVSMHDFRPHPTSHTRPQSARPALGGPADAWQALVPGDVHTIYDMNPLYAAGITGRGQTIVVIEDTNVYDPTDWITFRTVFGLTQRFPYGSFTQIHPQTSNNPKNGGACLEPGVTTDDDEAILDAQYASAVAPNAAIVLASCSSTNVTFGGLIAVQNLLTGHGQPSAIISVSYSNCETEQGSTQNAYYNYAYEMGVLQGVSVFVSAGDSGAAVCDYSVPAATYGINVNGIASTPHNVAVGGTDFADTYFNQIASYWSSSNGQYYNSALSYIPEIPWNGSCGNVLAANYLGFSTTYGVNGFCNSAFALQNGFIGTWATSGGPSNCAYGNSSANPNLNGVANGTCQGYPKPAYQWLVRGNHNDGVRDLPDVSMFASNGTWTHYLVYCDSDPYWAAFGAPCSTGDPTTWSGGGGTSFASPMMAGIQAMINQATEERQGNPNFVYYALAAIEYNTGGSRSRQCNSTLGNQIDPNCIFHDVTLGDNDIDCQSLPDVVGSGIAGTFNCYWPGGIVGVLSTSNNSYQPAYTTATGWDFSTGLGSVNAYNLVKNWPGSQLH